MEDRHARTDRSLAALAQPRHPATTRLAALVLQRARVLVIPARPRFGERHQCLLVVGDPSRAPGEAPEHASAFTAIGERIATVDQKLHEFLVLAQPASHALDSPGAWRLRLATTRR
jgi:hypothetical protein